MARLALAGGVPPFTSERPVSAVDLLRGLGWSDEQVAEAIGWTTEQVRAVPRTKGSPTTAQGASTGGMTAGQTACPSRGVSSLGTSPRPALDPDRGGFFQVIPGGAA